MKFFNLLHLCLMSFMIVPFIDGMMPLDFPDDIYFSLPSSEPSSSSESSGKLIPRPNPISKIEDISETEQKLEESRPQKAVIDPRNDESGITPLTDQKTEQPNPLQKKLKLIADDLIQLSRLNAASSITPTQAEKAEKLRKDLELLQTPYFNEIPSWPGILKENISKTLNDYYKKELEKELKLKVYFTPAIKPTEPSDLTDIKERVVIPIDKTINSLAQPLLNHPLAEVFVSINAAIVENSEDSLMRAIVTFLKSIDQYKKTTINAELLRLKESSNLKNYLLNFYLSQLSKPYTDFNGPFILNTTVALSKIIPNMCQSISLFLEEIYRNQELSDTDSPELVKSKSELISLAIHDLLMICQYLQQKDKSLTPNISLLTHIVLKTKLNRNSMQACLLLLNKVGNFYPQIQSDLASTIIDDIVINYFTLSEQAQSQKHTIEIIGQAIKWLAVISSLEPPLSENLPVSNIADDELEDYLEKITLLEHNCNPSPSAQKTLLELQAKILKEVDRRSKRSIAAKLHAKKDELEIAKKLNAEEASKLQAREKSLKTEKQNLETEKIQHTTNIADLVVQEKLYREEIAKLQAEEKRLKADVTLEVGKIQDANLAMQALEIVNKQQIEQGRLKAARERAQKKENLAKLNAEANAQQAQEQKTQPQTPSFFETIQSWFNWLFWEQYKS